MQHAQPQPPPPPAAALQDRYQITRQLGSGGFGHVYVGVDRRSLKVCAVKCIDISRNGAAFRLDVLEEVAIMKQIQCIGAPHCVWLYDSFETQDEVQIVMELCKGLSLGDAVKYCLSSLSWQAIAFVLQQLCTALSMLHAKGIMHRDLSLNNVMFTDSSHQNVKLIDFGLAKMARFPRTCESRVRCGTPGYRAPEMMSGDIYDSQVDMWSLGVVAYLLLLGFPGPVLSDSALVCMSEHNVFAWPERVPPEARDLVRCLLRRDPSTRLRAEQALSHPFIQRFASM